ncbi:hypothetical protein ER21_05180 [Cronobacter sakazakii]|nr:hypothetical protein ER21_05180 [Cronobacter sakazakii]
MLCTKRFELGLSGRIKRDNRVARVFRRFFPVAAPGIVWGYQNNCMKDNFWERRSRGQFILKTGQSAFQVYQYLTLK